MNALCRIGLHRYRDIWRGHWDGLTQKATCRCTRCGKQNTYIFVSPLSGPRRGPMYPDPNVLKSAADAWGRSA